MISTKDIHWLAGLLEGEGCFTLGSNKVTPSIHLATTDPDVAERAASILGFHCTGPYRKKLSTKPYWSVSSASRRAAGWMMTLYPLMGRRRQARIAEVLAIWKATKPPGWAITREGRAEIARRNYQPQSSSAAA